MRIKVNDKWYDGDDEPVMVEFDDSDKENILKMKKHHTKYCQYTAGFEFDLSDFMECIVQ